MESFPWWSEEQRKLASELKEFIDGCMPRAEEAWWKREFPWDIIELIARKGYFGAGISKEYGGMGLGVTGDCIATEEVCRMPSAGLAFAMSRLGGVHQITNFGTEQQKAKLLPKITKGELGAIAITEIGAGTDAAAIETFARRDGDKYIITGKKRFTHGAGLASRYMLYARTSNDPEDIRRNRHLTGFLIYKGMPGFSVEKINELIGLDNMQNGHLDLDEVPVPVDNVIGGEGRGWEIMMSGLNYERVIASAFSVSWLRETIGALVPYMQRRIQFGRPTIDLPTNRFKIADLICKLKLSRLATYYAAYLFDLGQSAAVESGVCKMFNADADVEASIDAIQCMGGDGVTKFYPLERVLRDSKITQIAAGTNEACKLVIYRLGLREMAEDLKMPHRVIHKELGVPIPAVSRSVRESQIDEDKVLKVLAEDYRVNPGLHMSREDLKQEFDVGDEELDQVLLSLEQKGLVHIYRRRNGIELAKATLEGLRRTHSVEYYRWFPAWVRKEDIF